MGDLGDAADVNVDVQATASTGSSLGGDAAKVGGAMATGAAIGGTVGTVIPVVGNVVGAAVGGIAGGIAAGVSLAFSSGPAFGEDDYTRMKNKCQQGFNGSPRGHQVGGVPPDLYGACAYDDVDGGGVSGGDSPFPGSWNGEVRDPVVYARARQIQANHQRPPLMANPSAMGQRLLRVAAARDAQAAAETRRLNNLRKFFLPAADVKEKQILAAQLKKKRTKAVVGTAAAAAAAGALWWLLA